MEWTCLDRWIFLQAGFFHKIRISGRTGGKGGNSESISVHKCGITF